MSKPAIGGEGSRAALEQDAVGRAGLQMAKATTEASQDAFKEAIQASQEAAAGPVSDDIQARIDAAVAAAMRSLQGGSDLTRQAPSGPYKAPVPTNAQLEDPEFVATHCTGGRPVGRLEADRRRPAQTSQRPQAGARVTPRVPVNCRCMYCTGRDVSRRVGRVIVVLLVTTLVCLLVSQAG